ncbi:MAG: DNA-protecting protein DprA [Spirochaetes bacterium]|nr:DNA-protecting protein DprA [Spirochaetota bacterium]
MKWKNKFNKIDLISFFLIDEKVISLKNKIKLFYYFNEDIDEILKFKYESWNKIIKIKESELKIKENAIKEKWDYFKEQASNLIEGKIKKKDHININVITIYDENYPLRVPGLIFDKEFLKPSPVIFYIGNIEILFEEQQKYVSIVGSRNILEISKEMTVKISSYYSKNGYIVVSGFAKGVDFFAHLAAIENGGKTLAVVGNGLDIIYPAENLVLYKKMLNGNSLLISEYPPGTMPFKQNFYVRNRLIAFIGNKIYFIQGAIPSGGLITAKYSIKFGKEVYSFFKKDDKRYEGNIEISRTNNDKVKLFNFFSNGQHFLIENNFFSIYKNKNNNFDDKLFVSNLNKLILSYFILKPYSDFNKIVKFINDNEIKIDIKIILRTIVDLIKKNKIKISNGLYYYPIYNNIKIEDTIFDQLIGFC